MTSIKVNLNVGPYTTRLISHLEPSKVYVEEKKMDKNEARMKLSSVS